MCGDVQVNLNSCHGRSCSALRYMYRLSALVRFGTLHVSDFLQT